MKTRSNLILSFLPLGFFFAFVLGVFAGTFTDNVSDLDAGNGYLTVTSDAKQTTQTFKLTSARAIVSADGKPGQLLDLIEGTSVVVDAILATASSPPHSPFFQTPPRSRPEGPRDSK